MAKTKRRYPIDDAITIVARKARELFGIETDGPVAKVLTREQYERLIVALEADRKQAVGHPPAAISKKKRGK